MADLYYIESGYYDQGYFVYTADAAAAVESTSSMTVAVGVIKNSAATLTAEFTQSATGSRGKDIDLYAMTDAALAVTVARLRTTNVDVSSVFTVASEVSRIKSFASDETAAFSLSGIVLRSRTASSDVQAAFSLACDATLIPAAQEANALLESAFTQTVDIVRNRTGVADLSSVASQTTAIERTRSGLADLTSAATVAVTISNQKTLEAQLSAQATVSAVISHIHGADLAAFTNADLSLTASVTRTFESSLQAQATQSTVVDRGRIASAPLEAITTINAIGDKQISGLADLTSAVTVNSQITRNQFALGDLSSAVSLSATATKIYDLGAGAVDGVVALSSTSTLSATISHIHGADLTAFSNASMSTVATVTANGQAALSSQATVSASAGKLKVGQATLAAYSSVLVSRYAGSGRPWNLTPAGYNSTYYWLGNASATGVVETLNDNFSAIPKLNDFYFFECFFSFSSYSNPSVDRVIMTLGPLTVTHKANNNINITIIDSNNTSRVFQGGTVSNLFTDGTQYYFAFIRAGETLNAYWGPAYLGTAPQLPSLRANAEFAWKKGTTNRLKFYNPTGWTSRVDEVNFRIGDAHGWSSANTSITPPIIARTNDVAYTQGLWHLNNSGADDVGIAQTGAAALTSTASITATLGGPVRTSAALTTTATMTTVAAKNAEIILSAFSNASLAVDATKTKFALADLTSSADQTTLAQVTRSTSVALNSEAAQTTDASRDRSVDATFSALASELVVGDKLSSEGATLTSQFTQTAQASRNQQLAADLTSAFSPTMTVNVITDDTIVMSSSFAQTTVNSRLRTADSTQDIQADLAAAASANRNAQASLSTTANFIATTSGLIGYEADLTAQVLQSTIANRLAVTSAAITSAFTQTAETQDSLYKVGEAALESTASVGATGTRNQTAEIAIAAMASELAAVVKIGRGIVVMDSVATLSADAVVVRSAQSQQTLQATVAATATRNQPASADLAVTATITADGTTNIVGEGHLELAATLTADADVTSSTVIAMVVTATVSCTPGRTRPFAALEVSMGTLTISGSRDRSSVITTESIATEMVIGDKLIIASAALSSQFTMTVAGRELDTGRYVYLVSSEDREWTIQSENRTRKIASETRIYSIRRY